MSFNSLFKYLNTQYSMHILNQLIILITRKVYYSHYTAKNPARSSMSTIVYSKICANNYVKKIHSSIQISPLSFKALIPAHLPMTLAFARFYLSLNRSQESKQLCQINQWPRWD